jgi:hypothetical protein
VRNGVKIYCVGFGAELNSGELRTITEQTEGAYYAASNVDELEAQFARIVFDLGGQYTLRWATLKRNSTPFVPSFNISKGWLSDKYVAQEYRPTEHQGNPLQGELRLPEYSVVDGAAAAFIRASYVPRWVRQFRFYVRSAYPFTVSTVPATDGGLCSDWPNPAVQDDPETGGKWVTVESGNLNDISTAIPFGAFGPIVKFDFRNLPNDMVVLFDELYVDNTVYEQTGGQSFIGLNINHGQPQDALVHEDFEATLDSDRWKLNGGSADAAVVEDALNQGNSCLFLHGADWSSGTASLELLQAVPLDNVRIDLWFRDIALHGGLGTDGHVTLMLYDETGAEIGSCNQYYSANLDIEFAGEDYIASETNLYSLSNWHQLSVIYETGTKTMRALVDGEEVHSVTTQGAPGRFARMKLLCAGDFFNSAQGYFDDISIYDATAPVEGEGNLPLREK